MEVFRVIAGCLCVLVVGPSLGPAVAWSAPIDEAADPRVALLATIVDGMEGPARAKTDDAERRHALRTVAQFQFLLGRREACRRIFDEVEAAIVASSTPDDLVDELADLAFDWAIVDPIRTRALITQAVIARQQRPEEGRSEIDAALSRAYFQSGDYRRALESLRPVAVESPAWAMAYYAWYARLLHSTDRRTELAELRRVIRGLPPRPEAVDPQANVDFELEVERIRALAAAGLPEEAASLCDACAAAGDKQFEAVLCVMFIVQSYARVGRPAEGGAYLRRNATLLSRHPNYDSAVGEGAALCGDFNWADQMLSDASNDDVLESLPRAVLIAHRAKELAHRDRWLARYRDGLAARTDDPQRGLGVDGECALAEIEAAIGRFDAALAILPSLEADRDFRLREVLATSICRELNKHFDRHPTDAVKRLFKLLD
jgi:tetratricopeptide (TPR) repeat protein